MSVDKYAQFIAEQQRKLSVSGTNPVNLVESMKPGTYVSFTADDDDNVKNKDDLKAALKKSGLPHKSGSEGGTGHRTSIHIEHDSPKTHDFIQKWVDNHRGSYGMNVKKVGDVKEARLEEKKHMSKADIAALKEPKDKFDEKDLEALRNKEHLKKEEVEQIVEKERTAAELKDKIKQHSLGHHATPETNWRKKKKHLQATSAAERLLAKLPRSKGGESVTKQGIRPVGVTKTQWKNKKWNEEVELDLADRDIGY